MTSKLTWSEFLIVVAIVLIGAVLYGVWNHLIYGDWTCMFAQCRKVVP